MSDNNPLDPTGKKGGDKAPLGDPSAPPNPSTRDAASQAGAPGTTSAGTSGTPGSTGNSTAGATPGAGGASAGGASAGSTPGAGTSAGNRQPSGETEQVREEASQTGEKLKSEAQQAASQFAETARSTAQAQAERQQQAAAGELGGIANALRKTADEVEGQSYLPLDRYARQAADKLDEMSESLRGSDVRTVLGRLETYTREQPGVVLGGAIISGFLLARFMRASSEPGSERGYSARAVH